MSDKPLIVIWGNPSSGKTTAAVKLAQALASHRKNVLVIFSDALCPSIATIVPHEASKQQSLGELLSLPSLTQEDLLRYSLSLKDTPYVALLGYKKGDHLFSYANYSRERAIDLLTLARHTADVVLVDCASYVSAYLLSTVALEMADTVFQFHTCDLKSMLFYASYLPLLSDARFKQGKTIPVLSNVKPGQDSSTYSQVVGSIRFLLPHVPALEQQMMEGRLLEPLSGKQQAAYTQSIDNLTRLILPDIEEPRKKTKERAGMNAVSIAQWLKERLTWRGAKK